MIISVCSCGCKGYELEEGLCPGCIYRNKLRQPIIDDLQAILDKHVVEFCEKWPGMEFGKAIVGNSICDAIRQLGGEPKINVSH